MPGPPQLLLAINSLSDVSGTTTVFYFYKVVLCTQVRTSIIQQRSSTGGPRLLGGPQRYCRGVAKFWVDENFFNLNFNQFWGTYKSHIRS